MNKNQKIKMNDHKVWDLVDPPKDVKIVGNQWAYTLKYRPIHKCVKILLPKELFPFDCILSKFNRAQRDDIAHFENH